MPEVFAGQPMQALLFRESESGDTHESGAHDEKEVGGTVSDTGEKPSGHAYAPLRRQVACKESGNDPSGHGKHSEEPTAA